MSKIEKLYKWELNNELYASIYFAMMLSIYSVVVLIHGERLVDIYVMIEMLVAGYLIALVQTAIFPSEGKYGKHAMTSRTFIWFICAMGISVGFSIVFGWFASLQAWALGAYVGCMLLGFGIIWLGIYFSNKRETKELNQLLSHYHEKESKKGVH